MTIDQARVRCSIALLLIALAMWGYIEFPGEKSMVVIGVLMFATWLVCLYKSSLEWGPLSRPDKWDGAL